jgi:hypothetical protein
MGVVGPAVGQMDCAGQCHVRALQSEIPFIGWSYGSVALA